MRIGLNNVTWLGQQSEAEHAAYQGKRCEHVYEWRKWGYVQTPLWPLNWGNARRRSDFARILRTELRVARRLEK